MADTAYKDELNDDFRLLLEQNRLETFTDWGFDESRRCNAKNMAEAGFVHVSGDLAKCVVCFKELEGWEPDDDPWDEHKKHTNKRGGRDCIFAKLAKKQSELTVEEFFQLCESRHINLAKIEADKKITAHTNMAKLIQNNITRL